MEFMGSGTVSRMPLNSSGSVPERSNNMNQFDKIRQEIELIEKELIELRLAAGRNQIQGSLKELSRKNDRIKNAFKTISTTISG